MPQIEEHLRPDRRSEKPFAAIPNGIGRHPVCNRPDATSGEGLHPDTMPLPNHIALKEFEGRLPGLPNKRDCPC